MYPKNPFDNYSRSSQYNYQPDNYNNNKPYLNFVNFQNQQASTGIPKSPQRDPEQIPMYSISVSQHPPARSGTPTHSANINRGPYLNAPIELRKEPPKQALSRNSSNKEPVVLRQSQQHANNKTQSLKNLAKTTSQGFNRISHELNQSDNKAPIYSSAYSHQIGSPNYSKTVDLGNIKYQQIDDSYSPSPQEQELKQKFNYLEVLEQTLRQFEQKRDPKDLKQLNEDNRQLMLTVFDQINRLKDDRSTKTVSDCTSEVDNYSEGGYSVDNRSDNKLNRATMRQQRRKSAQKLSQSRQKARQNQIELQRQMKLNQSLKLQYEEQIRRSNQKEMSELQKLMTAISNQEKQIQKLNSMNSEISVKLQALPFYQQWQIMCGEAEGAKRTSIRIKEELVKRRERLKEIQRGSTAKNITKTEETVGGMLEEGRESSLSKNKLPVSATLKVPPTPMNNRLQNTSIQNSGNRSIPDSSIKSQNRSRSSHRQSSNN